MRRKISRGHVRPLAVTICLFLFSPGRADGKRAAYRLDSGDVLAVIVDGVLGDFASAPVHMPSGHDDTLPAIGYPTPVLPDGTIMLPIITPVSVRGLSVTAAKQAVGKAYRDQQILNHDHRVSLTLMRKRTINVLVVHDATDAAIRKSQPVRLPADRSSVLGALVESESFDPHASVHIRSPRGRSRTGLTQLRNHDLVWLRSSPPGHFYAGGRLAGGRFPLPSSRQPNALQAVAVAGGVSQAGILGPRLFGPPQVIVIPKSSSPIRVDYPALLNNPSAVPIRSGDTIIAR